MIICCVDSEIALILSCEISAIGVCNDPTLNMSNFVVFPRSAALFPFATQIFDWTDRLFVETVMEKCP